MFNEKDMQEYKDELKRLYDEQPKATYKECEATRHWLLSEYKDACDCYERNEFTPEQFNDVADLFTELHEKLVTETYKKRDEWTHSSQF